MRVRHVNRGALIANVDDADALPGDVIPDRLDVAALQTENAIDAARFQEPGDPAGAGSFIDVEVLGHSYPRLISHMRAPYASLPGCGAARSGAPLIRDRSIP